MWSDVYSMSIFKSKVLKSICLILTCGILSFTMGCEEEQSDGKGYLFNYTMMQNPQNLDPQIATDSNSITVIDNTFTGLMTKDDDNNIVCGVAESYTVSEDGLTYVFYLRKDYKWYTSDGLTINVTADDFLFTFQRLFNPEMQSPYGEKFSCLKNAQAILNGNEEYSYTDIGVYTSDSYTITFLLDTPNSEFLDLLTQSYAMPCNREFFNSTHSTYGLYDYSTISNGAFYVKQWFYDKYGNDNFLTLRRNPMNPNYDDYSPYAIQFTIDEDTELSEIQHSFYKDETDLYYCDTIDSSSIDKDDVVISYNVSTVGIVFNIEDAQFKSKNLRNAFAYSIDRTQALEKSTSDIDVAYGIVPSACTILGKSYRDIISETETQHSLDEVMTEYQTAKSSLGEISDVRIIMENGVDSSFIKSITDNWKELFGVNVLLEPLTSEEFEKTLNNQDYQIAIYCLTSEDNRPYSFLSYFLSTNEFFSYSNLEVDTLLKVSEQYADSNSTIETYAQIEDSILQENIFVPLYYNKEYLVCGSGIDNIGYNPFNHQFNFEYALNYNQDD